MSTATRHIKDLLDLPTQVDKGDFVLKLVDGVTDANAKATLQNYVVTDQLVKCFDQAMGFIKGAVDNATSKACYLHGSFGSGKSHFMAVLHLLLQNNADARAITELAPVVSKHNPWTQGRKFMLVPFHMIGSRSMEHGILGGYAEYVRRKHPGAPAPEVYLGEHLLEDAKSFRQTMGDAAFFGKLNEGKSATGGGWGAIGAGWDVTSFETAVREVPGSPAGNRGRLLNDLLSKFFRSYHNVAAGQDEAYVDLDHGLAAITRHAKELGYDGLILFLDELILWLASHAADVGFIHRETQKLVKLVEAQQADRPIPLISFVARQRDLRKLIGETVPGAQKINFDDSVDWSDGRFGVIKLEDRNLPVIANRRVIRPKSEAARHELNEAFESTAKVRKDVMDTLLANEYDREMFRLVYPFSPALMETLVGASSMLQRERTALKVMLQLLVDQKDTLKVGDIVPVGDLYDAVAQGDEAFSAEMRIHFDNAKRLYLEKLLPLLEAQHGPREQLLARPADDQDRQRFRNDDRIIKTLLLAALVPGVPTLRGLTVTRLAALNHGTIKSPIPNKEASLVLKRVKEWAGQVGEIKVGDDPNNPTVSIQLSGVDTESIIANVTHEDTTGNRAMMVRRVLFEQFGLDDGGELFQSYAFQWKNTERECDLLFRNLRELNDSSLQATNNRWKVVIDYPFDEVKTSKDHIAKVTKFRSENPNGTRTIVWIPAFFTESAKRDLGRLVLLEFLLTGERLAGNSANLSPQDRVTAKSLLENQRSVLRERVRQHVEHAYGLRGTESKSVDTSHELSETFRSLLPGLEVQPPSASNLREALEHLLAQALAHEYPAAPAFEAEVKPTAVRKAFEEAVKATSDRSGRVLPDKAVRPLLRGIAQPLKVGEQGEQYFALLPHWNEHFGRKARDLVSPPTVAQFRRWIDEPAPMGLPRICQDFVILVYAAQNNRSVYLHGGPDPRASIGSLDDAAELREQPMPSPVAWETAVDRAKRLFGKTAAPALTATNVSQFMEMLKSVVSEKMDACRRLCQKLPVALSSFGLEPGNCSRFQTAEAVLRLLEQLSGRPHEVVELLARFVPRTSEAAMGDSLGSADRVMTAIEQTRWELFDAIRDLPDSDGVSTVLKRVSEALAADETVVALSAVLDIQQKQAIALLRPAPRLIANPEIPRSVPLAPPASQSRQHTREYTSIDDALRDLERLRTSGGRDVRRITLTWDEETRE